VAAAVGRFDKGNLVPAFSHLGPLTRRFPRSQAVRYYLGLLLAWTAQGKASVAQFRQAVALDPHSDLGQTAAELLKRLQEVRTGTARK